MKHRLTGRRQFAAVRAERNSAASGALRVHLAAGDHAGARFGFVVPRSAGGAVVRNRIRRRLRAALEPHRAELAGFDVVVSAGTAAATQGFAELTADLARCLERALATARARARRGVDDASATRLAENGAIRPGSRRPLLPTTA